MLESEDTPKRVRWLGTLVRLQKSSNPRPHFCSSQYLKPIDFPIRVTRVVSNYYSGRSGGRRETIFPSEPTVLSRGVVDKKREV